MLSLNLPEPGFVRLRNKNIIPDYGGVYAFYSEEGYLLYIGKTKNFRQRSDYHLTDGYKNFIFFMETYRLDEKLDREIYETYLINKWMPLLNIRKTLTYKPLAIEINEFQKYSSVQEIMTKFSRNKLMKTMRKINVSNELTTQNIDINELVNTIIGKEKSYEKSDLRKELANEGCNVNEIMTKKEFDIFLRNQGYKVSDRMVYNSNNIKG